MDELNLPQPILKYINLVLEISWKYWKFWCYNFNYVSR